MSSSESSQSTSNEIQENVVGDNISSSKSNNNLPSSTSTSESTIDVHESTPDSSKIPEQTTNKQNSEDENSFETYYKLGDPVNIKGKPTDLFKSITIKNTGNQLISESVVRFKKSNISSLFYILGIKKLKKSFKVCGILETDFSKTTDLDHEWLELVDENDKSVKTFKTRIIKLNEQPTKKNSKSNSVDTSSKNEGRKYETRSSKKKKTEEEEHVLEQEQQSNSESEEEEPPPRVARKKSTRKSSKKSESEEEEKEVSPRVAKKKQQQENQQVK
ncbi:predicted protein [Naegleria gruberi]|uniref:Predicted protein n=1 Tax=Naegleria gruberi TaxID=5762 RepID=D2VI82_NAEGR|nr:uncharacterized protein NAEGRDRAFT_68595 [Naegleria gruberi]EFC43464.1 predicted protein [Naegleria gruberi]|eukprot:XP_002676208.1 predicted protein [Naegleria gruberi strain NEG-M]